MILGSSGANRLKCFFFEMIILPLAGRTIEGDKTGSNQLPANFAAQKYQYLIDEARYNFIPSLKLSSILPKFT